MKAALVMLVPLAFPALAGEGAIAGKVLDATSRKPVPAAVVTALMPGWPPAAATTRTGAGGAFLLPALAPGRYAICVQAGDLYLNPCQWEQPAAAFSLESGQTIDAAAIYLAPASVVTIDLLDRQDSSNHVLEAGRPAPINLGVWGPRGLYHPARPAGRATLGGAFLPLRNVYRYQIGVPCDVDLILEASSAGANLGDAAGQALPANSSRLPFRQSSRDTTPRTFTFTLLPLQP